MLKPAIIKFVGFDLDRTLYQDTKEIHEINCKTRREFLSKELGITEEAAEQEFNKQYKRLGTATGAVKVMGIENAEEFSARVSSAAQIHPMLKKDQKLVNLISYLKKKYQLFLITASSKKSARLRLNKLGLNLKDFNYSVFGDCKGSGKPWGRSFNKLLNQTKAKPQEHLYIGDRDVTDIIPAQKAGMQTVLVWGESERADLSLSTIYDLGDYL